MDNEIMERSRGGSAQEDSMDQAQRLKWHLDSARWLLAEADRYEADGAPDMGAIMRQSADEHERIAEEIAENMAPCRNHSCGRRGDVLSPDGLCSVCGSCGPNSSAGPVSSLAVLAMPLGRKRGGLGTMETKTAPKAWVAGYNDAQEWADENPDETWSAGTVLPDETLLRDCSEESVCAHLYLQESLYDAEGDLTDVAERALDLYNEGWAAGIEVSR